VPGSYQFVDHSMFRAFNKGAMGALQVDGALQPGIYSGRQAEEIFNPGTHLQRVATTAAPAQLTAPAAAAADPGLDRGKQLYTTICTNCHQPDGRGLPGVFPPLAQSDFLMSDASRAMRVLLEGLQGPITVNGKTFDGVMPNFSLADEDIAAVLSYVRSNFGNAGSAVMPNEVQRVRSSLAQSGGTDANRVARGSR
jgi:nitrite reductase (NO-forming)